VHDFWTFFCPSLIKCLLGETNIPYRKNGSMFKNLYENYIHRHESQHHNTVSTLCIA
jgi:hypothetical protein